MCRWYHFNDKKEELKRLLKERSEKAGLKLNIQKNLRSWHPVPSWQIEGEKVETMTYFLFLGFKITADGDCSHEIKRRLLLGRKAMANLDSILKSRDITLLTLLSSQSYGLSAVMYGCESWTIKKVECKRTDAFELWCWRRLLRVPWTVRRSNQSILKGLNPEHSLEGLMLKLKLQYFGHLMQRADSLEKILMLRKIEGNRRRGRQRMRWLYSITNSMDMNLSKLREIVELRAVWCAALLGSQKVGDDLVAKQQQIIPTFNLVKMYTLQLLRLPTKNEVITSYLTFQYPSIFSLKHAFPLPSEVS